jgi:aspartate/methionine/tyrosine aminotransferase
LSTYGIYEILKIFSDIVGLCYFSVTSLKNLRDGFPCDWQNIMLCAGASEGIRACLKLMTSPGQGQGGRPGVMIPTPQYPLYSASLAEYNMEQVSTGIAR